MNYIQVDIEIEAEEIEPVTGLLLTLGITDTVVEDPKDLERLLNKEVEYEWDYIAPEVLERKDKKPKITFYLEDGAENEKIAYETAGKIKAFFPLSSVNVTVQNDDQWKDKWKEFFKPTKVAENIWVKPTWETYTPKEGELVIEIDPGMAFGTGTHETTSLCIKLMEKYLKPEDKLLDVGCGSGILAIGGALLGAKEILGVDIDPEAVKVSGENIILNKCQDKVNIKQGNLVDGIDFEADVIVANLMADLVIVLSEHVAKHLKPGGIYISSGILTEKEALVSAAIESCGFEIIEIREDDMWCAIAAKLPS